MGDSVKKKHLHTEELRNSHSGAHSLFFQVLFVMLLCRQRERHGDLYEIFEKKRDSHNDFN